MDFVVVRPPIDEPKPSRLGVVGNDEAGASALRKHGTRRIQRCRDELGAGVARVSPDAVDLQAPVAEILTPDEPDRAGLVHG